MTIPITEEQWDEFLNLLENRLDQQDTEIKLLKDRVTELEEQQQKKNKPKAINVVKRLMLILRLILTLTMVL